MFGGKNRNGRIKNLIQVGVKFEEGGNGNIKKMERLIGANWVNKYIFKLVHGKKILWLVIVIGKLFFNRGP